MVIDPIGYSSCVLHLSFPLIQGNLLKSADNDTPMELKQKSKRKKGAKGSCNKAEGDLSGHLADIELKLDHIIELIKDSLYHPNICDHREEMDNE